MLYLSDGLSGGVIFNKKEEVIFEKDIPMNIVREISKAIPVHMSIVYKDEIYIYFFSIFLGAFCRMGTSV